MKLKQYTAYVNGMETVLNLTEDEAAVRGLAEAETTPAKAATKTPTTKSRRGTPNKAATAPANKAKAAPDDKTEDATGKGKEATGDDLDRGF